MKTPTARKPCAHSKWNTRKRAMEHAELMRRKAERIAGLRALMATHEEHGNAEEARRIGTKIRLCEQELRYMDG